MIFQSKVTDEKERCLMNRVFQAFGWNNLNGLFGEREDRYNGFSKTQKWESQWKVPWLKRKRSSEMKTKYALIHDSVQMVPRVYLGGYDQ